MKPRAIDDYTISYSTIGKSCGTSQTVYWMYDLTKKRGRKLENKIKKKEGE